MKTTMISCVFVAFLSLPIAAAQVAAPRLHHLYLLALTADVERDTLSGVILARHRTAVFVTGDAAIGYRWHRPLRPTCCNADTAGIGGGSVEVAAAQALNCFLSPIPAAGHQGAGEREVIR